MKYKNLKKKTAKLNSIVVIIEFPLWLIVANYNLSNTMGL